MKHPIQKAILFIALAVSLSSIASEGSISHSQAMIQMLSKLQNENQELWKDTKNLSPLTRKTLQGLEIQVPEMIEELESADLDYQAAQALIEKLQKANEEARLEQEKNSKTATPNPKGKLLKRAKSHH